MRSAIDDLDHVERVDLDFRAAVPDELVVGERRGDREIRRRAQFLIAHLDLGMAAAHDDLDRVALAGVLLLVEADEAQVDTVDAHHAELAQHRALGAAEDGLHLQRFHAHVELDRADMPPPRYSSSLRVSVGRVTVLTSPT
jgi:hypothetical protein